MAEKTTLVVSELIEENSAAYCRDIVKQTFPNPVDGLKSSKRRVLQTQDPNKQFPSSTLIGNTFKLHNHNHESIYQTACAISDSFKSSLPLLILIGDGNAYFDDKAAAARYTEWTMSEVFRDFFVRGVNLKTLPTQLSVDMTARELTNYIPKVPTALLYPNKSIGYGFNSLTVSLGFKNVCFLVKYYIANKSLTGWNYKPVVKKFLPVLPINCSITNTTELLWAYKQGNFRHPISTEGVYWISNDKVVIIRTICYGESPDTSYGRFVAAMGNRKHWIAKADLRIFTTSTDGNYADFKIILKKSSLNIFEVIDNLKSILMLKRAIHPKPNYSVGEMMVPLGYPQLIEIWYKARYESIISDKQYKQQQTYRAISELETFLLVCDKKKEVMQIIEKSTSRQEMVDNIESAFTELTLRQCEILVNTPIHVLSAYKKDEIIAKLGKLKKDVKELLASYSKIDEEIITSIDKLDAKYSKQIKSKYVSFQYRWKGYVIIDGRGVALFETDTRMYELLDIFKKYKTSVELFDDHGKLDKITIRSKTATKISTAHIDELSPTYHADRVILEYPGKQCFSYTGTRWTDKGGYSNQRNLYIGKNPYAVSMTKGIIKMTNVTVADLNKRRGDIVYLFDPSEDEHLIIFFTMKNWNMFSMQRMRLSDKLILPADEKAIVIAVRPISKLNKPFVASVPLHPKRNLIMFPSLVSKVKNTTDTIGIGTLKKF